MPRFRCYGKVVGSKYLGVFEAETEEEATEKALASEAACISLCHQCAGECEDPEVERIDIDIAEEEA
jgi:hypothetical protein